MSFKHPSKDVLGSLQTTRILLILAEGGNLRLQLANEETPLEAPLHGGKLSNVPKIEHLWKWEQLLILLAEVQPYVSRFGRFSLTDGFTQQDFENAQKVHSMCTRASWSTSSCFNLTRYAPFTPDDLSLPLCDDTGHPFHMEIDPYGDVMLFGVRVPMGQVRVQFNEPQIAIKAFQRALDERSDTVRIPESPVELQFLEWQAPGNGPSMTAWDRRLVSSSESTGRARTAGRKRPKGKARSESRKSLDS